MRSPEFMARRIARLSLARDLWVKANVELQARNNDLRAMVRDLRLASAGKSSDHFVDVNKMMPAAEDSSGVLADVASAVAYAERKHPVVATSLVDGLESNHAERVLETFRALNDRRERMGHFCADDILYEEFLEFVDAAHRGDLASAYVEASHVAAVAVRIMKMLKGARIKELEKKLKEIK